MACIFYLFAKEKPQEYKVFTQNLFRKGVSSSNQYKVEPTEELLEKKLTLQDFLIEQVVCL